MSCLWRSEEALDMWTIMILMTGLEMMDGIVDGVHVCCIFFLPSSCIWATSCDYQCLRLFEGCEGGMILTRRR